MREISTKLPMKTLEQYVKFAQRQQKRYQYNTWNLFKVKIKTIKQLAKLLLQINNRDKIKCKKFVLSQK